MDKNTVKMHTDSQDLVQLVDENEVREIVGEAIASVMLNPTVVWAKFILTDDRRNANGQRVPMEEFDNLIRSGIHMPVKMAVGEIKRGHDDSEPLGVITHLKKMKMGDNNAIMALAALWGTERPSDVAYIKERFIENLPVNVSWEILYGNSTFNQDNSSEDLHDTVLKAATIVGEPAYEGRTQFISVAAKKWSEAYIGALPDTAFLYIDPSTGKRHLPVFDASGLVDRTRLEMALNELGELNLPTNILKEKKAIVLRMKERLEAGASLREVSAEFVAPNPQANTEENKLNELDTLKAQLQEVEEKLKTAMKEIEDKDKVIAETTASVSAKEAEMASLAEKVANLEAELTPLKEFKASLDAELEKKSKLDAVVLKFKEAGIEKEESFFSENEEKLLALDATALDFMIAELKAFGESAKKESLSSKDNGNPKVPVIINNDSEGELSVKELAQYLRESRKTKSGGK